MLIASMLSDTPDIPDIPDIPDMPDYLTIEALQNDLEVRFTNACEYCVDGDGNWKTLAANT